MEKVENKSGIPLLNAYLLSRKVLYGEDDRFYKEDWQILQVAHFIVSKEKFLKKDKNNCVLHYYYPQSFFYIEELSDAIYEVASYVYNHNTELVIDRTKSIHYVSELPEKYRNLTKPTFDEALLIINMIRNSIVHGKAYLDSQNSFLNIDSSALGLFNEGNYLEKTKTSIPISLISKLNLGDMMKKNRKRLQVCIFDAISKGNYEIIATGRVEVTVSYLGKEYKLNLSSEEFYGFCSKYEESKYVAVSNNDPLITIDKSTYMKLVWEVRSIPGNKSGTKPLVLKETSGFNDTRMIESLMKLFGADEQSLLNPQYTRKFFDVLESEYLSPEFKLNSIEHFRSLFDKVNFHNSAEETLDSISYLLGIEDEEKAKDLVALFSYLVLYFSNYPLKYKNVMLTEFLDLSKLTIDYDHTDDKIIQGFYKEVRKFIKETLKKYNMKKKAFDYQMPCINFYTKIMAFMVASLKKRNNVCFRHIRNALTHSNITLSGNNVILSDCIQNGSSLDRMFEASISIDGLVELTSSYSKIYDIRTYPEYCQYIETNDDFSVSFTIGKLIDELSKGIDNNLIKEFVDLLKVLSRGAFGRELSMDDNIATVMNKLAYVAQEHYRKVLRNDKKK